MPSEIKFVLGVDCSSKLIDAVVLTVGKEWVGSISLESKAKDVDTRLAELYRGFNSELHQLVSKVEEDAGIISKDGSIGASFFAVIENPIYIQNVKATVAITQVVAAAKVITDQMCSSFLGVDNRSWKKSVLGTGRAEKEMIMNFAKSNWGDKITSQDIADAYCLALWGCLRMGNENTAV